MKKRTFIFVFIFVLLIVTLKTVTIAYSAQNEQNMSKERVSTNITTQDNTTSLCNQNNNYAEIEKEKSDKNIFFDLVFPFIIEFFGAFLGIIAAILLDSLFEKQKYKSINQELFEELTSIKEELNERYSDQKDDVYFRYLTPVWNIHMESGNLELLTKIIHQKYIDIYTKIQYAQELENEYIHCRFLMSTINQNNNNTCFNQIYINEINNLRNEQAVEIIDLIDKLEEKENNANRQCSRKRNKGSKE